VATAAGAAGALVSLPPSSSKLSKPVCGGGRARRPGRNGRGPGVTDAARAERTRPGRNGRGAGAAWDVPGQGQACPQGSCGVDPRGRAALPATPLRTDGPLAHRAVTARAARRVLHRLGGPVPSPEVTRLHVRPPPDRWRAAGAGPALRPGPDFPARRLARAWICCALKARARRLSPAAGPAAARPPRSKPRSAGPSLPSLSQHIVAATCGADTVWTTCATRGAMAVQIFLTIFPWYWSNWKLSKLRSSVRHPI
jgi:hypothetical protein